MSKPQLYYFPGSFNSGETVVRISIYISIPSLNKTKLGFLSLSINQFICPPHVYFPSPPTKGQETHTNELLDLGMTAQQDGTPSTQSGAGEGQGQYTSFGELHVLSYIWRLEFNLGNTELGLTH
uniref:Uncharacterized protein n=1 Tax=Molossus molossus TaxID=27622 RepID=A0A7J8I018_MOLMO|nr:hypothetical protein HJG59_010865 [Molossus molossus]